MNCQQPLLGFYEIRPKSRICDSTNWVGKIRVPTIVISSAEDIFATPEEGKALAEEIKKSGAKVEYKLIDESGHAAINEAPEELCAILDGLILQNMQRN